MQGGGSRKGVKVSEGRNETRGRKGEKKKCNEKTRGGCKVSQ